jgi:hypothetical protein
LPRHSVNTQRIKDRLDEGGDYGGGDSDFRGFSTGDNYLRILPPWSAEGDVFKGVSQWYLPKPVKGICYNYARMNLAESCPVQAAVDAVEMQLGSNHAFLEGNPNDPRDNGCNCRNSFIGNALFYRMEVDDKGDPVGPGAGGIPGLVLERPKPFIVRLSYTVAMAIYEMINDPALQPPVVCPDQGRILRVRKPKNFEGKSNYEVMPLGVPHALGPDDVFIDKLLTTLHDLDKIVNPSEKQLQRVQSLADKIYTMVLRQQPQRTSIVPPEAGVTHDTVEAPAPAAQPSMVPPQQEQPAPAPTPAPAPAPSPAPQQEQPAPAPAPAPAPPQEQAAAGQQFALPKPDCYTHHPPSDKTPVCEGGGVQPWAEEIKCQLCPWEHHCATDSVAARVAAGQ